MYMGTYFLACLRGAKDPNNRYFGLFRQLVRPNIIAKLRVVFGRRGLVKVNAILKFTNEKLVSPSCKLVRSNNSCYGRTDVPVET